MAFYLIIDVVFKPAWASIDSLVYRPMTCHLCVSNAPNFKTHLDALS